jgi:cell wall-associated NlpC family hydrolase
VDGWARVRTAYAHEGWIAEDALGDGAADAWLGADGGDPLTIARRYVGARYLWGGMTANGIDCSGLVHISFRRAGKLVPRDADEQEQAAAEIDERDARPGDLVTYGEDGADHATHIAFWLGGGRILNARSSAGRVLEEDEPQFLRAIRRKFVRL